MNLAAYLKEFRYAMSAPPNWHSRISLLSATAAFHLNNWSRGRCHSAEPIEIELRIGSSTRRITVRPTSGDIFILYEVLAFESYKVPEQLIDPATVRTLIDCGANIGITALFLADRYPAARIICVEPDPRNFELLERNTRAEPRIVRVQAALAGPGQGKAYLTQDAPAWGNKLAQSPEERSAIEVESFTIDEICERFEIDCIDLLKVDIEGAEEGVFAKPQFLSKVRFVAIELHQPYNLERFRKDLEPMRFQALPPSANGGVRAVMAFARGAGSSQ